MGKGIYIYKKPNGGAKVGQRKKLKGKQKTERSISNQAKSGGNVLMNALLIKATPLSNCDIEKIVKSINIPGFKGVFMRNDLPIKALKNKCAVVNLDNSKGPGTHWVCYVKSDNFVRYYDSFGVKPPP